MLLVGCRPGQDRKSPICLRIRRIIQELIEKSRTGTSLLTDMAFGNPIRLKPTPILTCSSRVKVMKPLIGGYSHVIGLVAKTRETGQCLDGFINVAGPQEC